MQKTDKYKELCERLDKLFEDVKKYATAEVTVCAATKTVSAEVINLAAEHGLTDIGENRVQELLEKYPGLDKEKLNIHFIGRFPCILGVQIGIVRIQIPPFVKDLFHSL